MNSTRGGWPFLVHTNHAQELNATSGILRRLVALRVKVPEMSGKLQGIHDAHRR
jgi:hypothetical protein